MVVIKSIQNKAYILLESLIALALFAGILSLLTTSIQSTRRHYQESLEQQEVLLLARMALQTQQNTLTLNGKTISIQKTPQQIRIQYQGKDLFYVEKD